MSKISYNVISILKHITFLLISAIDQSSFELYGKLEGKIFKEKFDVLKKDRIISYRKFNQHSFQNYIYLYTFRTRLEVHGFTIETRIAFIYTVFANTFTFSAREADTIHSACHLVRDRIDLDINRLPYLAPPFFVSPFQGMHPSRSDFSLSRISCGFANIE